MSPSKRWLFVALLAACVPATEDADPRGGVVARLVPSAATSGQPFQSADGWTVTIEKFAIRVSLLAERPVGGQEYGGYIGGFGAPRIVTPSEACELRAVAVSAGPAAVTLDLQPRYSGHEAFGSESICGVDPELVPYFNREADSVYPYDSEGIPDSFQNAPSLVLLGRAEKNGRTIRLELAVDATSFGAPSAGTIPTTIVANQGALVRMGVDASALFLRTGEGSVAVPFDGVAAADTNGDGLVTGSELGLAKSVCSYDPDPRGGGDDDEYCDSLLSSIVESNASFMFGPPPGPNSLK